MSLYFQAKIRGDGKPLPDMLATHGTFALAATGWSGNRVTISGEDGQIVSSVARSTQPTSVAWHPSLKVLAVGWKDGVVSLWREDEPNQPTTTSAAEHNGLGVISACWSTAGTYLTTSSKSGAVVVWQLENGCKLSLLCSVKNDLPAVRLVHLNSVTKKLSAAMQQEDDLLYALCTGSNIVALLDEGQNISPLVVLERDQVIVDALWDAEGRNLVTLTSSLMIAVHHIDIDMKVSTTLRRKISAPSRAAAPGEEAPPPAPAPRMTWAAAGIVGLCCGDDKVRLFSIQAEVVYILACGLNAITAIASELSRKLLVAASADGRTVLYRFVGKPGSQDADDWTILSTTPDVGKSIDAIRILSSGDIIFAQDNVAVTLQETQRKRKWTGTASAFQVAPEHVLVETVNGSRCLVKVPSHVREIDICFPQVAVWTGSSIAVYSITESTGTYSALNAVDSTSGCFGLHTDGILRVKDNRLVFDNFQLQPIAQLAFTDSEGTPVLIDVQGDFIAVVTSKKMMKIARIAGRELRSIGPSRPIFADHPELSIARVRINSTGKRVAILANVGARNPDTRVWVFEVETDRLTCHDFKETHAYPTHVTWNTPPPNANQVGELEHLLLACETKSLGAAKSASPRRGLDNSQAGNDSVLTADGHGDGSDEDGSAHQLVTLFATSTGVVVHHTVPLRATSALVGVTVPNVYIAAAKSTSPEQAEGVAFALEVKRLRDFEGLAGDSDVAVREALMRFGYYTTVGNMDEAYRAVKTIKDPLVWQNLARMCVTTKRLDVAEVCLANMQDGVAARALREAKEEPELETRLGVLAASLGMREEAEKLFRKAKRQDRITEMHIACGSWEAAQKNAELSDRIRLRQVLCRYAQWMESISDFNAAVNYYQRAGCGGTDVPRLYFLHQRLDELKSLVFAEPRKEDSQDAKNNQRDVVLWWAQYQERSGNLAEALKCYEMAEDVYNTVRLLTIQSPPQIDKAVDVVVKAPAKQQGAAYFIGLYHEQQNSVSKALQFYAMAGATRRAIQLAKASDLHGEVVALVLKSEDKQLALETANWFESRNAFDKAVQLYQKGGDVQRAIDVCIRGGLYDILNQISESLDQGADPETFIQMAEHFLHSSHFDKAAQMLIFAKAYNEALQLCVDKNVKLSDEMAEAMTLPKADNDEDEAYRISLLKKIAKVAKDQESWHLACKKYTQAGERVKAMKMLLRAGDTEKVMFFANHSRNNEIYVLAGNYLQSQDWQHDANIYKNIVTFYTKAKAFENLASFYDACSQLQIDEYRNYDNALLTLREALKALEKGDASLSKRSLFSDRIAIMESFVNARRMIQPGKPSVEMVQICTDLITRSRPDHPDHELIDAAIRVGDVFALLVEYYDKLNQVENAYSLMDRMRQQGIELTFFLEQQMVERICKSVGRDAKSLLAATQHSAVHHAVKPPVGGDDEDIAFEEEEV